jgi:hypothetical protein
MLGNLKFCEGLFSGKLFGCVQYGLMVLYILQHCTI